VKGEDLEADLLVTLEEAGTGGTRDLTLRGETGTETIRVKIPMGVREGQRIRVPGKGHPAPVPEGKRGDLYLRVRLEKHPDFRVEGDHVFHEVEIEPWEAALGCKVPVPTLNRQHISVTVPEGSAPGRKLRVKGLGLPRRDGSRGDLYVVVQVRLPEKLTPRARELWEGLRREYEGGV